MNMTRRSLLSSWTALPALAQTGRRLFSFALVADAQYADKDAIGARQYRESLAKLRQIGARLAGEKLEFAVHLGDLVDGGEANLGPALKAVGELHKEVRLVAGNHDFVLPREESLRRMGLKQAYYDFTVRGWRFVVLDCLDIATAGGRAEDDPKLRQAQTTLAALKQAEALQAQEWNGGVSAEQLEWLKQTLDDARRRGQRAIVLGHQPLLPEGCRPEHVPFNYGEILDVLDAAPAVAAYFAGHDHLGGTGVRGGVPYITLKGLVENTPEAALQVVDVYEDRLVVRGDGAERVFGLRPASGAGAWKALFDGRSLNGWQVECKPEDRGKTFWSARDGMIQCDSIGHKDHDYFWLMHEAEYADFELELEVRGDPASTGNSGLQFRSRYNREMGWLHGPQVDIHPPAPFRTGLIYDETFEAKRWIEPSLKDWNIAPAQAPHKFHWSRTGWNRLRLECRGTGVRTWLNGLPVVDYNGAGVLDDEAHRRRGAGLKGHFALQLHASDELRIEYRNIRVRPLGAGV